MKVECLFTGDLAEELRDVAPYLCEVGLESAQIEPQLELILATQVGMLVVPRERDTEFGVVYRHFRKFNVVYGPEGNPLFFRYYDPRVLEDVLRVLDASQLEAFFGPVDSLMLMNAEGEVRRLQQRGGSLEVR